MNTDPITDAEWRRAAILAEALLRLDSARQYGLITGGNLVNVERCNEVLAGAKTRGIVPTTSQITTAIHVLVSSSRKDVP